MVAAKKLSSSSAAAAKTKPLSLSGKDKVCKGQDLVGSKIRVWWPLDRKFYNGVVDSYNSSKKKHRVLYEDGEKETLNMKEERWELLKEEDDDNADEDNETYDVTPELKTTPRTNGKMGDIGGKIVAAASRMRSINKISEETNGKKKRASSSSSEAVSEKATKPRASSRKGKRNKTEEEDGGNDELTSEDDSKPLQSLVDKLKGKKKKRQEKEAPKEEVEEVKEA